MTLIELQQPGAFATYLQETKNTVCGRHAVAVWLRAVEAKTKVMNDSHSNSDQDACNLKVDFVRYAQSSPVLSMSDSSVSYAAAVAKTTAAL
jgi:predicted class III extradiol MEMO1 family dioxygenase